MYTWKKGSGGLFATHANVQIGCPLVGERVGLNRERGTTPDVSYSQKRDACGSGGHTHGSPVRLIPGRID